MDFLCLLSHSHEARMLEVEPWSDARNEETDRAPRSISSHLSEGDKAGL